MAYTKNPKHPKEIREKWRILKARASQDDPMQRERILKEKRKWTKTSKAKNSYLKNKYGITLEQHNNMLVAQEGKCAVCEILFEHRRINVDHDHKTGEVRGLLCYQCNTFRVGGNTLESAKKVVEYLKREKALGL